MKRKLEIIIPAIFSTLTIINLIAIALILSGCSATPTEATSTPEVTSTPIVEEVTTPEVTPTPTPEIPQWLDSTNTLFDIDFMSYFSDQRYNIVEGDEFDTNRYLNRTLDELNFAIFETRGEIQPTFNPNHLDVRFYPYYENDPFEHNAFCIEIEVQDIETNNIYIFQFLLYTRYDDVTKTLELAYNDPACNAVFTAQIKESTYLTYYHEGIKGETMAIIQYSSYENIDSDIALAAVGLYQYNFFDMKMTALDPTTSPELDFSFFDPDRFNEDSYLDAPEAVEVEPGVWAITSGDETQSSDSGSNSVSYPDQSFYNLEALGADVDSATFNLNGQRGYYMLGYWTAEMSTSTGTGHVQMRSDDGITWRCVTSGAYYDTYWSLTSSGWTMLH